MNEDKVRSLIEPYLGKKGVAGIALQISELTGNRQFSSHLGNFHENSRFFIASTTKLFTTAIIFQLIDQGKLSLSTKIAKYLSADQLAKLNNYREHDYSGQIEVQDLLMHTSGIPDYFMGRQQSGKSLQAEIQNGKDQAWDFDQALLLAKSIKTTFPPRQQNKALYSDTNYQILGRIAELINGKSINELYQSRIFAKLGLADTYLYTTDSADDRLIDLRYKESELNIPKAMASFAADGGIVSTLADMTTFTRAYFSQKLFNYSLDDMNSFGVNRIFFPLQYSLGMMKVQLPRIFTMFRRVPPLYGHSGLSGAFAYYSPDKDLIFVGTVNQIANPSISYNLLLRLLMTIG